ncbi:MAG: helix-hairpin-helix domain-containing protein [Planctomycetota bacterium]
MHNRDFFLIDLNKATKEELRLIPYVSEAMAQEIIRYRTDKGGLRNTDELSEIKGIGPARLKKMRKYLKKIN